MGKFSLNEQAWNNLISLQLENNKFQEETVPSFKKKKEVYQFFELKREESKAVGLHESSTASNN